MYRDLYPLLPNLAYIIVQVPTQKKLLVSEVRVFDTSFEFQRIHYSSLLALILLLHNFGKRKEGCGQIWEGYRRDSDAKELPRRWCERNTELDRVRKKPSTSQFHANLKRRFSMQQLPVFFGELYEADIFYAK